MILQLASYKVWGNPKSTLMDKAISIATLSNYSHSELVINEIVSFSSSPRDDGVRMKTINMNSDQWDIINIPTANISSDKIYDIIDNYLGNTPTDYDFLGAILGINSPPKQYCSKLVHSTLVAGIGLPLIKNRVTPNRLRKEVLKWIH